MSNHGTRLGLGNSINAETEVLHTSILGKRAFGRITDLLLAWTEKHHRIPAKETAAIRILTQALLEFAYPEGKQDLGHLEFAIENEKRFVSIRFPGKLKSGPEEFEREITQFWMNSDKAFALKKNLGPHDRVEVRFHQKLNTIEWRVIHRVGIQEIELTESSFVAYVDGTDKIGSFHKRYTDLGDLPFERLLAEIYRNSEGGQRSGELFYQGQSLQKEEEVARVVFEKEQMEIDEELRFSSSKLSPQEIEKFYGSFTDEENEEIKTRTDIYLEQTIAQLRFDQVEAKETARQSIREAKQRELQAQRRMITFHQKIIKLEDLLKKKEMAAVRSQNQVKLLSDKVTELQSKLGNEGNIKAFRDKALQMQAMLIRVKEEKTALEKTIHGMKNREKDNEAIDEVDQIMSRTSSIHQVQLEEVSKKADRLQRALDAEKLKVKQLSERVINAERESVSAGPMIEDLERKVEQAIKLSQFHKKDSENSKQKLVQSEGEKNKLKNELNKTRAEIQTLLKRQAG